MGRSNKKNITYVVSSGLCLKCGLCYSICPENAIAIKGGIDKNPIVNNNCVNCSRCVKVCPGLIPLSKNEKETQLGIVRNCYIGYSMDNSIRKSSTSGGIVTSININLLQEANYKGVICIRQKKDNIFENEVILATSIEDILSSKGSRYAPAFVCGGLKDLNIKKGEKYVFVGKPCDIQALTRYETIHRGYNFLKIALFCSRTPPMTATKEVLDSNNVDIQEVRRLQYRGNGWPGWFIAYSSKKDEIKLQKEYLDVWDNILCKIKYYNKRCMLCHDCTGEYADISVGDAWLDEYIGNSIGHSVVITRSSIADDIVRENIDRKNIMLGMVNEETVLNSQKSLLNKKNNLFLKRVIGKLIFERLPEEDIPFNPSTNDVKRIPGLLKYYILHKLIYRKQK
ncbi:MAG: Coenzyme F420 hydrogenase/dehydrogenase, beta subunit C-terminal domain [Spirochaetota bacterium]|nr:Coenzyme F420 hydrogenase/dehydrogenase, beta subunit C-terminal domain [Spirochaetota bacterium]